MGRRQKVRKTGICDPSESNERFRNLIRMDLEKSLNKAYSEIQMEDKNKIKFWCSTNMARDIELSIWTTCDGFVDKEYRDIYRLLISNLNDPSNSDFRRSVCTGELLPS